LKIDKFKSEKAVGKKMSVGEKRGKLKENLW